MPLEFHDTTSQPPTDAQLNNRGSRFPLLASPGCIGGLGGLGTSQEVTKMHPKKMGPDLNRSESSKMHPDVFFGWEKNSTFFRFLCSRTDGKSRGFVNLLGLPEKISVRQVGLGVFARPIG